MDIDSPVSRTPPAGSAVSFARPVYVRLRRRAIRLVLPLVLAALAGCHPDLDWREIRPPEAGFVAMLPGRVAEEARPLSPAFPGVTMRQWSSRARDSVFAAGYADLPARDAGALAALRSALVANVGGTVEADHPVLTDGIEGRETVATGAVAGRPVRLRLRLYQRGSRIYQVAVLGPPGDLSEDEAQNFLASFRLREAN